MTNCTVLRHKRSGEGEEMRSICEEHDEGERISEHELAYAAKYKENTTEEDGASRGGCRKCTGSTPVHYS